jgi:hypothetical protein
LDRAGFSSAALASLAPQLTHLTITGYGDAPAAASLPSHDMLTAAMAGLMVAGTSSGDTLPSPPATMSATLLGGAWPAATHIILAVNSKRSTYTGVLALPRAPASPSRIHVGITPNAPSSNVFGGAALNGLRDHVHLYGSDPFYRVYRARTAPLAVAASEAKFQRVLAAFLGLSDAMPSTSQPPSPSAAAAVAARMQEALLAHGAEDWLQAMRHVALAELDKTPASLSGGKSDTWVDIGLSRANTAAQPPPLRASVLASVCVAPVATPASAPAALAAMGVPPRFAEVQRVEGAPLRAALTPFERHEDRGPWAATMRRMSALGEHDSVVGVPRAML